MLAKQVVLYMIVSYEDTGYSEVSQGLLERGSREDVLRSG